MITGGFTNLPKTQTEYGNGSHGKYEFWDGADGGVNDGDMIWGPNLFRASDCSMEQPDQG